MLCAKCMPDRKCSDPVTHKAFLVGKRWRDYDVEFSFRGTGLIRIKAESEEEAIVQANQAAAAFDGKDEDLSLGDRMHGVVVEFLMLECVNTLDKEAIRKATGTDIDSP